MTHKYYIFVHNTELIEYLESVNKFTHLENYQYVLLSDNDFNTSDPKVIVSRDQPLHIESFNNYLQWTGWYSLVANNIIDTDYVTLLEYDVDVDINADKYISSAINTNDYDCLGYAELPKTNSFLNNDMFSSGLNSYLTDIGINPDDIIKDNNNTKWIVTSNITIKSSVIISLVKSNMFINFLNYMKNNKLSGHFLERFITVYLTLNNHTYNILKTPKDCDIIRHYAVDSHNTQGRHSEYLRYKEIL